MIKLEEKEIINKWASIKRQINILEKESDLYKPQILELMLREEVKEMSVDDDKITTGSRRSHKYPAEITKMETEFNEAKKECERLGTAKYTENFYPIFSDSNNKKHEF